MGNKISARQLCVAGFTGLLTLSAAAAGLDWRGALLAVPVVVLAVWAGYAAAKRRGGLLGGTGGIAGKLLALLYIMWGVFAAGVVQALCAQRMSNAGGQSGPFWPMVLAAVPMLWLSVGKPEAFARAAEIFYLAMMAAVVIICLLGVREVEWRWLLEPGSGLGRSVFTAAGIGCMGVYALLLWNGEGEGEGKRWLGWTAAGGLVLAALSALTVGSLSPALTARVEQPFFVMTVGLGRTARTEALAAMVWLVSDVTLLGLLLQSCRGLWKRLGLGGEKAVGAVLTAAAFALALCVTRFWDPEELARTVVPAGGLLLGGAGPVLLWLLGRKGAREK